MEAARQLPTSASADTILQFTLANGPDGGAAPAVPGGSGSPQADEAVPFWSWDFDTFRATYLDPLGEALAPVLRLHVQSQVGRRRFHVYPSLRGRQPYFHVHDHRARKPVPSVCSKPPCSLSRAARQVRVHTSPGVAPRWSAKRGAHVLKHKKLPFFVNSDWSLDLGLDAGGGLDAPPALPTCPATSTRPTAAGQPPGTQRSGGGGAASSDHTPAHVLRLVLYVPPPSQQPLQLLEADGAPSPTNSFRIPSWGAVHVLRSSPRPSLGSAGAGGGERGVGGAAGEEEGTAAASERGGAGERGWPRRHVLDDEAMHGFAEVAVAQLRLLLGLPALPHVPGGDVWLGAGHAGGPAASQGKVRRPSPSLALTRRLGARRAGMAQGSLVPEMRVWSVPSSSCGVRRRRGCSPRTWACRRGRWTRWRARGRPATWRRRRGCWAASPAWPWPSPTSRCPT